MSSNLANRFIDDFFRHLGKKDVLSLAKLLNIKNEQYRELYFREEAKRYLADKLKNATNEVYNWGEIFEYYALARNSLYNADHVNAFEYLNKSFKALIDLIKDAKEENWQLPVMFRISVDLRLLAYACDSRKQRDELFDHRSANAAAASSNKGGGGEGGEGASNQDEYAEKTAESLMICFRNLCTDTRSDSQVTKRWGMMHIVNQLFKIYFKINKINLCNPLKRVIENSGLKDMFPESHQIVYKFYVGRQAMFENDYNTAASYLEFAFQNCSNKYN
jgi:hypothetical protein